MANFVSPFEKWGRRRCRFRPSWPYSRPILIPTCHLWLCHLWLVGNPNGLSWHVENYFSFHLWQATHKKKKTFLSCEWKITKIWIWGEEFLILWMLYPPGFYYVKKTREVAFWTFIRRQNHKPLRFFGIIKPRRIEHLQNQEPFSSDPYFSKI